MSEQQPDSDPEIIDLENEVPGGGTAGRGDELEAGQQDPSAGPEVPKDPLAAARQELAHWRERALRTQADLENFRKRAARDRADAIKFGNAALLEDLLPIADNFEMGLAAALAEGSESSIGQGMQMVHKQLVDFLASNGLREIETEGKTFDPNVHEALSQQPSDDVPEGQILASLRKGYQLHDRLLRAANVIVSTGPAARANEGGEE